MKRFQSILCASLLTMATASNAFAGNITTLKSGNITTVAANGNITTLANGNITTLVTDYLFILLSVIG